MVISTWILYNANTSRKTESLEWVREDCFAFSQDLRWVSRDFLRFTVGNNVATSSKTGISSASICPSGFDIWHFLKETFNFHVGP